MRRTEKAMAAKAEMEAVIRACPICRLALSDDGQPYVLPMNFGYENNTVYLHAAREGRKLDVLRKNNRVCVEFTTDIEIVASETSSNWSTRYACVIGTGTTVIVDDPVEKRHAYDVLMQHYTDKKFDYPDACISRSCIIKIMLVSMTGKRSG